MIKKMEAKLLRHYEQHDFILQKEATNILNLLLFVYVYSLGMFVVESIITQRIYFLLTEVLFMTAAMAIAALLWHRGHMDIAISLTGLYGIGLTLIIFSNPLSMRFYMQLLMVLIVAIIGYRKPYQYLLTFFIILPITIARIITHSGDDLTRNFIYMMISMCIISYILFYFKQMLKLEIEVALALKKAQETDILTGIPNRRNYENNLKRHLNCENAYLILIDIDHFKAVNDQYGHPTGDLVLIAFSKILDTFSDHNTRIFRWGGEEFLIVHNGTYDSSIQIAETLRQLVENYSFEISQRLTISLGISDCTHDARGVDDSFLRADKALYLAKENGRNRVETFFSDKNESVDSKKNTP